ncbi:DUF6297 family protein [Actinopolymorpha rutila]|uniref:ABC-2 type transport system permease protein n=1 Tax=Actinopolymorpha rutila TaxID=446787 RepID=A0A852ZY24_9ACTN|nr:hypothetical protein [Actinopolymorpha rutila]
MTARVGAPSTPGRPITVPTSRHLRRELRQRRRDHSNRTLGQALDDLYLWLFAVLMVGSMAGTTLSRAWLEIARCSGPGCVDARLVLPLPLGAAVLALAVRTLVALGPMVASRASGTFLLSTPVDRRGLLLRPAAALMAGAIVLGAGLVSVLVLLTSSHPVAIGAGALAGAGVGVVAVAASILAQGAPKVRRALGIGCDVVVVATLAVVPLLLLDRAVWSTAWARPGPLVACAAVAAVVAVALVAAVVRRIGRLPRRELVAGGELLSGLAGAAASLDTSMVSDLLVARRFRQRGAGRTLRGHGSGLVGVAVREAQRSLRSPQRLALAVGLLAVPYAVDRIGVPTLTPLLAVVVGYLALRPLGGGLHVIARSAGLRRAFPVADRPLRIAFAAPLLAAAVLWALAALPAVTGNSMLVFGFSAPEPAAVTWLALAATIAAGGIRSVTRQRVSYDGALISTPAGALPAGFVAQIFRGPDFALVGIVPLVFGLPWVLALGLPLALLAFAAFRG